MRRKAILSGKIYRAGLILLFGCFVLFFFSISSIHPNTLSIQEKLIRGRETSSVRNVTVMSSEGWADTGVEVFEGEVLLFQSEGVISLQEGNPIAYCGPEGYDLQTVQQPIRDRNIGALIGKVVKLLSIEVDKQTGEEIRHEQVEYFYIGKERKVTMPLTGHLYLGVNETVYRDNSGAFRVTMFLPRTLDIGFSCGNLLI
ncbi:MAG: hypothetical protein JW755_02530 [Candidatus Aminicenantes bacterium]|nr:hypothetical protein [Candidatus Aminicenantes bacterium]